MSSSYGENLRFTIFGQSHSPAIGVTVEGLPAGFPIDFEKLQKFLNRRAPGRNALSTQRKESDVPHVVSGLVDGHTCGAPLTVLMENQNQRPKDYSDIADHPRPGHADFTAQEKFFGFQDIRGGGHFSGRLTAPLCVVGGICMQLLEREGIFIGAHILSIGRIFDDPFPEPVFSPSLFSEIAEKNFPVLRDSVGMAMQDRILDVKSQGDSIGGQIECAVLGLPAGLGDPMFGGMENRISQAVFGVPAIKGIDFGSGFDGAFLLGSQNNDPFTVKNHQIQTESNHHGGILGGITSGMPLRFRVAVKPTPSIAKPQNTVSLSGHCPDVLEIHGRHDPCIVPRAVPCIEAAAAVAVYDALLERKKEGSSWI